VEVEVSQEAEGREASQEPSPELVDFDLKLICLAVWKRKRSDTHALLFSEKGLTGGRPWRDR
jgi:hypothetical protein